MRYRLDVVGPSTIDVVRHAGGWLFDRALAGWEVSVLTPDYLDARALRILGAEPVSLDAILDAGGSDRRPHVVAVSADLYALDPRIGPGLRKALGDGGVDVAMWGATWPVDLEGPVDNVEHKLSLAARAFKGKALAAAGVAPNTVTATEAFRTGVLSSRFIGADLVPAG
ncbi:hypothetical protein OG921_13970 [Aldersonia sp. NBC_00410]|uniref:hypothetical protein n=1 Tax=Aldersonia sp. NBC_00410 TaxID=2975954 RepID=UPI0022594975|nr:hypothetical protein [Aldersonia sp. NBC_00410]MCX5044274.1 hypothetical protein [Aldersonia sp. NBC_00410]